MVHAPKDQVGRFVLVSCRSQRVVDPPSTIVADNPKGMLWKTEIKIYVCIYVSMYVSSSFIARVGVIRVRFPTLLVAS